MMGTWLMNILNSIGLWIDTILYSFISYLYQVFIVISKANLFTESTLRTIIDRVFIILGVIMLFYIAYEILMLIVNPDKVSGENQAKILVSKFITAIVIIILLPTIFKYMHVLQTNILTSNVIGNVVLGSSTGAASDNSIKSAGAALALSVGQAFYHPEHDGVEYSYLDCVSKSDVPSICEKFTEAYDMALAIKKPGYFFGNSSLKSELNLNFWENITGQERQMRYHPIMSTIAAFLAIRMIIAFSLDIGIRVAKLGFLQIVAPIPIAQNITKKESIMQTLWFKTLLETYLDIFMKLIVIYFSMFTIGMVPEVMSNLWYDSGADPFTQMLATVAIILGILQFAKDAPKLIKDLFKISDKNLDFNIKKRMEENTYAQRGIATLGSGGATLLSNAYNAAQNIKDAEGGKEKIKAIGRGAGSTIGGFFAGGYRGYQNSEGMTSWGQLGDNINRTRVEADASRTNREGRRQLAQARGEEIFDDAFGNPVVTGGTTAGRVAIAGDNIVEFGQRTMEWLRGSVSTEKLNAATAAKEAFDKLRKTYENKSIRDNNEARQKQSVKFRMGEKVVGIFEVDQNGIINRNREIDPNLLTKKQINDYYDALNYEDYADIYTKEQNRIAIKRTGEKSLKILEESLNTLGTEAKTKFIESMGISSLKEIEKIFEGISIGDLTPSEVKKLEKISVLMNGHVNEQLTKQSDKDKK